MGGSLESLHRNFGLGVEACGLYTVGAPENGVRRVEGESDLKLGPGEENHGLWLSLAPT